MRRRILPPEVPIELLLEVRIFSALALLTEELRFDVDIRVLSPFFRDFTRNLIWEVG